MKLKYYIPNQHGAWAMLIVPFLFGMIIAEPNPQHLLLFVCWLLVYLMMFPILQWIRTKKTIQYLSPILFFGTLLVPFAIWLIVLRPKMILIALMFIPLFLVNAYFAKTKNERALINDIAAIVQFSLMVFISFEIGEGTNYSAAMELFFVSILYFVGTAFYVKTIIREKNNRSFYYFSVGYHVCLVLLSMCFLPWMMVLSACVLLIRALWFPRMKISVKQSGISEIVFSIVVLLSVWLSYGI
ncbi:YwiC-like family protein [Paenibacillus segetis]|uniref:Membrane protein n=1 Tax=Paenibacillus segetis TaxID=1325360 RepID=A0ABQ1Y6V6_9BACL|nr:YwiC-like family protein [Paenibacillus segetis]GGH14606.1 membrane protein [Paenibacillus segetis]